MELFHAEELTSCVENDVASFVEKRMQLKVIILSKLNDSPRYINVMYVLTDLWLIDLYRYIKSYLYG